MALVIRHGGESHNVRPDRVYRTGVLQSISGYQPSVDVQSVAMAFTQGPAGLAGFGAGANWFERLKLRFMTARAARQANKRMFQGPSDAHPNNGVGPAAITAQLVAPQIASQMQLLTSLTANQNPAGVRQSVAEAVKALAARGWRRC